MPQHPSDAFRDAQFGLHIMIAGVQFKSGVDSQCLIMTEEPPCVILYTLQSLIADMAFTVAKEK